MKLRRNEKKMKNKLWYLVDCGVCGRGAKLRITIYETHCKNMQTLCFESSFSDRRDFIEKQDIQGIKTYALSYIRIPTKRMFFTLSYTAHTILSISLHIIGVVVGLFVWYLFPKNPTRSIVKLPAERITLIIEPSTVIAQPQDILFSHLENEKLIDFDGFNEYRKPLIQTRNFG